MEGFDGGFGVCLRVGLDERGGGGDGEDEGFTLELRVGDADERGRSRIRRALSGDAGERRAVRCGRRHLHVAVVGTVAAATCGKVRVGVRREGEQGRDHWQVEEQQQRKCEKTPHSLIVQT